jgi:hypothetical protein
MCTQRISRIGLVACFCSAALALIGIESSASSMSSAQRPATLSASVERAGKGDSLTHVRGHVRGSAASNAIAVDLTGPSDVVIRGHDGNILFAVNHATQTTTVGKQNARRAVFPETKGPADRPLPDGCEGAFSPYVEPAKANIIGRCVS